MFKISSKITLFGLSTISAAYAQFGQPIQANIPFAFTVQDTTLASGDYQLTYNNSAHILTIRGSHQRSGTAFATEESGLPGASPSLVFNCYNKTCYLARIRQGAIGGGRGWQVRETERRRTLSFATRVISITIPAK